LKLKDPYFMHMGFWLEINKMYDNVKYDVMRLHVFQ
jgi:hypothetical protein